MKKNKLYRIAAVVAAATIGFVAGRETASNPFKSISDQSKPTLEERLARQQLIAEPWEYDKEMVKSILEKGYAESYDAYFKEGVVFKTLKGDTPERLARILFNDEQKWREIYVMDERFDLKNYEGNTILPEELPILACLPSYSSGTVEERIRAFQNTFPQREAVPINHQMLEVTRDFWKHTPITIKSILSSGYAIEPEEIERFPGISAKKIVFKTVKGDTLRSIARSLYHNDNKWAEIKGYSAPDPYKTYDRDAQLLPGLNIQAYMSADKLAVFADNFPDRKVKVIE